MKSIMEEASSIMEAIQKGWERAGKPQEFSVKVFEDAQTSFFGMRTVKSAKIALFYKEVEKPHARPTRQAEDTRERRTERTSRSTLTQARERREERPRPARTSPERPESAHQATQNGMASKPEPKIRELRPEAARGAWNDEMIDWVNSWVRNTLQHSGHEEISFTTESSRNLLRIDFVSPIVSDEKQERLLFSSFAHLIMSSLRNKFKGDLKHLKVVLNSR